VSEILPGIFQDQALEEHLEFAYQIYQEIKDLPVGSPSRSARYVEVLRDYRERILDRTLHPLTARVLTIAFRQLLKAPLSPIPETIDLEVFNPLR